MNSNRRIVLAGLASTPLLALPSRFAFSAAPTTLKISHQFPASSGNEGDFRDRLCRRFAQELDKRSSGALNVNVYPGASLMKVNAQFSSMRIGALDMALIPLSYVGGEVAELNISLMPGLVTSYEQGYNWKTAPIGKALTDLLADKGVILVSWIWQAGGAVSRN